MIWPVLPMAARVQVSGWPAIWLPLIVLWPVFVAVFGLALPLCVLVPAPRRALFATIVASYQMLCSLHGMKLEIEEPTTGTWNIAVY